MSHAAARLLVAFLALSARSRFHSPRRPRRNLSPSRPSMRTDRSAGNPPEELTWSPDGKHLTYIDGGQLIDLDPGTGKPHVLVSRAKLATLTERRWIRAGPRPSRSATRWPATSGRRTPRISCSTPTAACGSTTCATAPASRSASPAPAPATIPSSRPTANRSHSFATTASPSSSCANPARPPPSSLPRPIGPTLNGKVDWVYEEELETRSNYFWSPDSTHLAYLQMNETEVPQYPIEDWLPTHATRRSRSAIRSPATPIPTCASAWSARPAARPSGSSCPSRPATTTFPASAGPISTPCGSKRSPATTSIATSISPIPKPASRTSCCS